MNVHHFVSLRKGASIATKPPKIAYLLLFSFLLLQPERYGEKEGVSFSLFSLSPPPGPVCAFAHSLEVERPHPTSSGEVSVSSLDLSEEELAKAGESSSYHDEERTTSSISTQKSSLLANAITLEEGKPSTIIPSSTLSDETPNAPLLPSSHPPVTPPQQGNLPTTTPPSSPPSLPPTASLPPYSKEKRFSKVFRFQRAPIYPTVAIVKNVNLLVGTPPQVMTVLFDTGSSLTSIACVPCIGKCDANLQYAFDYSLSKSVQFRPCDSEDCCAERHEDGKTCVDYLPCYSLSDWRLMSGNTNAMLMHGVSSEDFTSNSEEGEDFASELLKVERGGRVALLRSEGSRTHKRVFGDELAHTVDGNDAADKVAKPLLSAQLSENSPLNTLPRENAASTKARASVGNVWNKSLAHLMLSDAGFSSSSKSQLQQPLKRFIPQYVAASLEKSAEGSESFSAFKSSGAASLSALEGGLLSWGVGNTHITEKKGLNSSTKRGLFGMKRSERELWEGASNRSSLRSFFLKGASMNSITEGLKSCGFGEHYLSGQQSGGPLFSDYNSFGSMEESNIPFQYYHNSCTYAYNQPIDWSISRGIIGASEDQFFNSTSLLKASFGAADVTSEAFGICSSPEGGVLTVGGYDRYLLRGSPDEAMKSARENDQSKFGAVNSLLEEDTVQIGELDQLFSWFSWSSPRRSNLVPLKAIGVNDRIISLETHQTMDANKKLSSSTRDLLVDTGTTYTFLPKLVHDVYLDAFTNICMNAGFQYAMFSLGVAVVQLDSPEQLKLFPKITFYGEGNTQHTFYPSEYFLPVSNDPYIYETGIASDPHAEITLGINSMMNQYIVFDYANKRIGIAEAACPSSEKNLLQSSQTFVYIWPSSPIVACIVAGVFLGLFVIGFNAFLLVKFRKNFSAFFSHTRTPTSRRNPDLLIVWGRHRHQPLQESEMNENFLSEKNNTDTTPMLNSRI